LGRGTSWSGGTTWTLALRAALDSELPIPHPIGSHPTTDNFNAIMIFSLTT